MKEIKWPIKNQNAKYKYGENLSKESSINISKEIFEFLGGENSGDIITVILRKKDFLLAFSKISSCLPLYYFRNGSQEAKFDSAFFNENYKEIEDHFNPNEEISYNVKLTINDKSTTRYYMYRMDGTSNFILRDFLIGENSFLNFIKRDDGKVIVQPLVVVKQDNTDMNFSEDQENDEELSTIDASYNRIIFGAPGTGKSYRLEEEALVFTNQSSTEDRTETFYKLAKQLCNETNSSYKLINLGFEYSDIFENLLKKYETHENLAKELGCYNSNGNVSTGSMSYIHWGADLAKLHSSHIESSNSNTYVERVTFHPNFSYAQFVGTYKPVSIPLDNKSSNENEHVLSILRDETKSAQEKYDLLYDDFKDGNSTRLSLLMGLYCDDDFQARKKDGTDFDSSVEKNHGKAIRNYVNLNKVETEYISYKYIPGPFMRIYVNAIKNPEKNYLLLIEEINRANVAAVFGDIFQLLDRKNGKSQYPIAASEDQKAFLKSKGINAETISIPANMYIWATMNSADQGVLPMDAAFKRRWEFEYLGIDDNEGCVSNIEIPVTRDGRTKIYWNDFRKKLNTKLAVDLKINEDKLLGPFFLSLISLESATINSENFVRLFESKVLMYLYEDVVKMNPKKLFSNCGEDLRYSKICEQWELNGPAIFNIDCEVSTSEVASE